MEWTVSDLNKRVKNYNRIYFSNEIELPIVVKLSRQLFNSRSDMFAYSRLRNNVHEIVISVELLDASSEMLRSVLVHELIHAWQDEHDPDVNNDFKELKGHGPAFLKKCEELNRKFKFRYPIQRYIDDRRLKSIEHSSTGVYYVYVMTHSKVEPEIEYPIGVFVKFMYADEIVRLVKRGLLVKYYKDATYTNSVENKIIRNMKVSKAERLVTYSTIKNCTKDTLVSHILNEFTTDFLFTDDDFNYQDGQEVEL